jgi:hypothetical protein
MGTYFGIAFSHAYYVTATVSRNDIIFAPDDVESTSIALWEARIIKGKGHGGPFWDTLLSSVRYLISS